MIKRILLAMDNSNFNNSIIEEYLTEKGKNVLTKHLKEFVKKCDQLKIQHNEVLDVGIPAEIIFNDFIRGKVQ